MFQHVNILCKLNTGPDAKKANNLTCPCFSLVRPLVHCSKCKNHLWTADSHSTKLTFTARRRPAVTVNVFIHKTCQPVNAARLLSLGRAWPRFDPAHTVGTLCHGAQCVQYSTEGTLKNILHLQAESGPGIVHVNVVFTAPAGNLKAFRQGYGCR